MMKKMIVILLGTLLISTNTMAQTNNQVEIFDISMGKVVSKVEVDREIQQEVEKLIEGISDVYRKLDPIPRQGFMVKIPLESAIMVQNQWFHALVDEVIMIFPNQDSPYFLMFDDENSPHFLMFEGETDSLLTKLKYKQRTS